jgi:hypothetical protein
MLSLGLTVMSMTSSVLFCWVVWQSAKRTAIACVLINAVGNGLYLSGLPLQGLSICAAGLLLAAVRLWRLWPQQHSQRC